MPSRSGSRVESIFPPLLREPGEGAGLWSEVLTQFSRGAQAPLASIPAGCRDCLLVGNRGPLFNKRTPKEPVEIRREAIARDLGVAKLRHPTGPRQLALGWTCRQMWLTLRCECQISRWCSTLAKCEVPGHSHAVGDRSVGLAYNMVRNVKPPTRGRGSGVGQCVC